MHTIDLVYVNAGGGHRSEALALEIAIRSRCKGWQVRLINLFEVLDPQDIFRRTTGVKPEDYYNARLARGWTLGLAQELRLLQGLIRLTHKSLVGRLRLHWSRTQPDLVVSLIPNFNRAMYQALARAAAQARRLARHAVVHETSGMIIHPDFYCDLKLDRDAEMRRLQLDPSRPTGLVTFGGHGSRVMRAIAKRLDEVQLILVCGHNAALARQLRSMRASAPRWVVGFTPQISHYTQLCDFFIGKPGPGSLSEAVQQGLPVIVVRNAWTMPQERYNTEWVVEYGAGVVLDSFRTVRAGVAQVTNHIERYRANVRRMRNRAVFEIPEILETILAAPARIGVDLIQHLRAAERLHLS